MTKVSLLRCDSYDKQLLFETVEKSIHNIGFDTILFKDAKVAVKPNLLSPVAPDRGITTHPEVFKAVVEMILKYGGKPVLIESPAVASLEKALEKCGYQSVLKEYPVEIADMKQVMEINYETGGVYKKFEIAQALEDVDIIINIPKLKTHSLTYLTAAVKNFYGFIPGLRKSRLHFKAKKRPEFSDLVIDLYSCLQNGFTKKKTFLTIMDAIICLEGEGPGRGGSPKHVGALLAGTDAIALDYIAVNLVGLDVNKVRTISTGVSRKLGVASFSEIEITGDSPESFTIRDFKPAKSSFSSQLLNRIFGTKLLRNILLEKPVPVEKKCTLCYQCRKICPADAITQQHGSRQVPVFDYNKCIRCFCCSEICPEGAIDVKKGMFA